MSPFRRTKAQKEAIRLAKLRAKPEIDLGTINKAIVEGFQSVTQATADYSRALQEMALVMGNNSLSVEKFLEAMNEANIHLEAQADEAPPPAPPVLDEAPPAEVIVKKESNVGIRAKFLE